VCCINSREGGNQKRRLQMKRLGTSNFGHIQNFTPGGAPKEVSSGGSVRSRRSEAEKESAETRQRASVKEVSSKDHAEGRGSSLLGKKNKGRGRNVYSVL